MIQIQCTRADVDARPMHKLKVSALDEHQHQHKCTGFESFLEQQDLSMYWPNSYTTEKLNHFLMFVKNYKRNGFKMPLNMKNINNLYPVKNGSVDVTITRAITHQKHLAQSGRSTRSAFYIFNTLHVFTKEPIREQEIMLKCMNGI